MSEALCVCGHSHAAHLPDFSKNENLDWSCNVCSCQHIKHQPDCSCAFCEAIEKRETIKKRTPPKRFAIRCPKHNVALIQSQLGMYCVTCLNESGS